MNKIKTKQQQQQQQQQKDPVITHSKLLRAF